MCKNLVRLPHMECVCTSRMSVHPVRILHGIGKREFIESMQKQMVHSFFVEFLLVVGALIPSMTLLRTFPKVASVLFLVASSMFALAFLFGELDEHPHYLIVLGGLLLPGVLGTHACTLLSVPQWLDELYAMFWLMVGLLGVGAAKEWWELPRPLSRSIKRGWMIPWILILSSEFNAVVDFAAQKVFAEDSFWGFLLFIFVLFLPFFFFYFVVIPTKILEGGKVTRRRWIARYFWILGSASVSVLVQYVV